MSSQKTEHYQLHQWQPSDEVLREEFNQNFSRLDTALGERIVTGSYVGDGTKDRLISLPFTPQAVILATNYAEMYHHPRTAGGIFTAEHQLTSNEGNSMAAKVVENGIIVTFNDAYSFTNWNNRTFYYIAFA